MTEINWRKIAEVGCPEYTEGDPTYLVTDGVKVATTQIRWQSKSYFSVGGPLVAVWSGDENTTTISDDDSGGYRVLDFKPTHWCPVSELNLPAK